jgi:trimeric autotransporter adhesin
MIKGLMILFFNLCYLLSIAQIWKPYGLGFTPPNVLFDLIIHNNELYAAGGISGSGTTIINGIARWDGANWNSLGTGSNGGGPYSMVIYNNELIAGGFFQNLGNVLNTKGIGSWDGTSWHSLNNGIITGNIRDMIVYNTDLYNGGNMSNVDSMNIRSIAR